MLLNQHPSPRAYPRILLAFLALAAALCFDRAARAGDDLSTESATATVNNLPSLYLSLGLGGAVGIGPAGMASLTVAGEHLQVTGRIDGASTFFGSNDTKVSEYGLMAGYGQSSGPAHVYAVAGLGMVNVERRGREIPSSGEWSSGPDYERVKETKISIPIQVGFDFGRSGVAGGFAILANLNSSESYVQLLLTVNIGKLR